MEKAGLDFSGVILMGPGRSGTTLLMKMLGLHPEFQFISNYNNRLPWLNYPKQFDVFYRMFGPQSNAKWLPKPSEAYDFWEFYIPGFRSAQIDEQTPGFDAIKSFLSKHFSSKKLFLIKITGFSRWQVFNRLLPNVKVLWVERDPVSVVESVLKQKWGGKHLTDEEYYSTKHDRLLFWCDRLVQYYQDKNNLTHEVLTIKLDSYLKNPHQELNNILNFIGGKKPKYFDRYAKAYLTRKVNKGKSGYTPAFNDTDREFILSRLHALRSKLGYE